MNNGHTDFETELKNSGRLIYTNVGVSMLPLIREGRDVLIIEAREPSALRKYDIVLFRRDHTRGRGRYILHRLLRTREDGSFFIAGDNCDEGENVLPPQILGVLTGLRRGEREIRLSGLRYRLYVALWCAPYPLRFQALRFGRFMKYAAGAAVRKLKNIRGKS